MQEEPHVKLYNHIAEIAARLGMKPAAFYVAAGLSSSLPTELKKGRKKSLSLDSASKLAAVAGISVQELLGIDEPAATPAPVATAADTPAPSKSQPAFLQSYALLDAIDQAKVEAYIAGLLAQPKYNG